MIKCVARAQYDTLLSNIRNLTYTMSGIRFVHITTYAKMCRMKRTSVYDRIKAGRLKTSECCEGSMIDILEYPPCRYKAIKQNTLPPEIKRELPDWCYD